MPQLPQAARDRKARELQGEFAYLNFPEQFEQVGRILMLGGSVILQTSARASLRCG